MDYAYLNLFLVVAAGFVATNLDNLVLLALLQSTQQRWKRQTAMGYLVACAVVAGVALIVASAGGDLDGRYVGFLGIVPALLGLKMLISKYRESPSENGTAEEPSFESSLGALSGTALLMLGNSGDSFALLLPLFLDIQAQYHLFAFLCYLVLALLWLALSAKVAANVSTAPRALQWGEKIAPWMMMGVGFYIFLDTAADTIL